MSSFSWGAHVTTPCLSFTGVGADVSACTDMYSGSLRLSLARSFTERVWVAENSSVCRSDLRFSRIAFRVCEKPCGGSGGTRSSGFGLGAGYTAIIEAERTTGRCGVEKQNNSRHRTMSRILSASSRTRTWMLSQSKPGVSSICWSSRPGVATRTFIPDATRRGGGIGSNRSEVSDGGTNTRRTDRYTDKPTKGRIDRQTDEGADRQIDRETDKHMNGQRDTQTDERTDGQ